MPESGKLVRDRIPEIICSKGEAAAVRCLSVGERIPRLRDKVVEEAKELQRADTRSQHLEELADLKEAYDALLKAMCINPEEVARQQELKRKEKGGFEKFYLLQTG